VTSAIIEHLNSFFFSFTYLLTRKRRGRRKKIRQRQMNFKAEFGVRNNRGVSVVRISGSVLRSTAKPLPTCHRAQHDPGLYCIIWLLTYVTHAKTASTASAANHSVIVDRPAIFAGMATREFKLPDGNHLRLATVYIYWLICVCTGIYRPTFCTERLHIKW